MKTSFITTVYNEESSIKRFLDSLANQTYLPDEIVVVDGGSTDATVKRIKEYKSRFMEKKVPMRLFLKKGNRSVGRNEAIKKATGVIILCSDSGNILDNDWIKHLVQPFTDKKVGVVAGYYKGEARTIFQRCLVPYVLVMPDNVNPHNFLPATRSMAFKKSVWENVGKFNENLSHNEDYEFAQRLKRSDVKIQFASQAIVHWIPRNNIFEAYHMFWRFAYGDIESGIIRGKVILLLLRYVLGVVFLTISFFHPSQLLILVLFSSLIFYLFWSVSKNYRFVQDWRAVFILPLLQITSDVAVLSGSLRASIKKYLAFLI